MIKLWRRKAEKKAGEEKDEEEDEDGWRKWDDSVEL